MEKKELTKNEIKEKMIKNCKTLKKIITVFEWIFIGSIIFIAIMVLLSSMSENIAIYGERFVKFINNFSFGKSIINFSGGIIGFMILDCLSKILKNVIEKETPFTEESIKSIKEMCILITIMWLLGTKSLINFGLVFVLAIWVLQYIFKYGYHLQLESDETL